MGQLACDWTASEPVTHEVEVSSPRDQGNSPKWADDNCRAVLEAAPDAMLVVNRAGEIVAANRRAEELHGYKHEQLIGRVVESLIPARLRARHRQHREHFFADPDAQGVQVLEIFALRGDGNEIPVDVSLSHLTIKSETFAISAIRDATKRAQGEELKRSEAVLRQSEERFRLVADTAPVLIWASGTDKLCSYFNKPWLDFTGRSIEEELGNGWAEGVHPEDLQRCLDTYTQSFDRREKFRMEYRLRRYDGEFRWILDVGVPRFNQDRSFAGYIGIGVDVTDRKRSEEALERSEEKFLKAFRASPMAITLTSAKDHRYIEVNDTFEHLTGYRREEVIGRTPFDIGFWVNPSQREELVRRLLSEGSLRDLEVRVRAKDGSIRTGLASAELIEIDGEPYVLATTSDITERKLAEDAVRESENRYRRIVETTNEGVWLLDPKLHTSYVNRQMEEMLGYEPGEMVGRSAFDFYFPEDFGHKRQALERRQQGVREQIEERLRRRDGSELWARMAVTPLGKDNGEFDGALAMVSDITERKRAEETLQESEERLRLAAQAGKMYAYQWDVATDVVVRSPDYMNVIGSTGEAVRLTRHQLSERVHPDDRANFIAAVADLSPENPTCHVTYRVLLPSGAVIWLEKNARAFFDGQGKIGACQRV